MKRKIMISGEFWIGATGRSLADSYRDLNYEVVEFDSKYYFPTWTSTDLRVISRALRFKTIKEYLHSLSSRLEVEAPDMLLAIKGTFLNREVFDRCRALGVTSAIYYPDYHFDYVGIELNGLLQADHFVTTKTFHIDFLKNQKRRSEIHFVHHGYGPIHCPIFPYMPEEDFLRDVSYVGTYTPHKERWMASVLRLLPHLRVEIFGDGWENASDPIIASHCYGARYGASYAEIIQSSRINIALHMESRRSYSWCDRVSTRTFEIPACKGFMLHIDNDEIRTLFEIGTEIDVFTTPKELAAKVQNYIADHNLRNSMINAAYSRCVPAYSYFERAKEIIDLISPPNSMAQHQTSFA